MTDEGYREIHLTGKQLVFLFMAASVVAVVIFLLGVLVGRGVQAERDTGAGSALVSEPQFLPDQTPSSAVESQPSAAQAEARPVAAPPPVDELSYPGRLEKKSAAPETLKPAGSTKGTVTPGREPAFGSKAGTIAKGASQAPAPPAAEASDSEGAGNGFAVQVAAMKNRSSADALVKRLAGKGYHAYVFAPKGKSPAGVFRVRVGTFKTQKEAEDVARRLKEQEQFEPRVIR